MDSTVVKEGKYTAIIMAVSGYLHKKTNEYRVRLELAITSGSESYKRFEKTLFFKPEELPLAKTRFNRMGGQLCSWESLLQDCAGLVGNKLVVEVWHAEQETDYLRANIHGYVGKDNPKKYSSG